MEKQPKTAIVIGATGLVGSHLLQQLLDDHRYSKVLVLHRRSTGIIHPKLEERIIDFDEPDTWNNLVKGDHLFSALGTTMIKAGSEEAQYRIDYTYQYNVAKIAAQNNVTGCALVSSIGARSDSKNFYLRMKGELDEAVQDLGFESLAIFKPSFLDGDREEFRFGEKVGILFAKLFSWIPSIRKYRPVKAEIVAKAMIDILNEEMPFSPMFFEADKIFSVK